MILDFGRTGQVATEFQHLGEVPWNPTLAKRPLISCMDCSTTNSTFGIEQSDLRIELKATLKELEVTV